MSAHRKPNIIHLLDDQSMGGVTATWHSLAHSRLKDQFNFHLVRSKNLLPFLQNGNADVIIFRNPSSWLRTVFLSVIKLFVPKVIILEHHYSAGFERFQVASPDRFHTMLRLSYGLASRVVSISEAQHHWMQRHRLVKPSKQIMIQQCRELDTLLEVPLKAIQQPLILGAYGRFSQQKGLDVLFKAIKRLSHLNIQLHVAGGGEDEALLQALAIDQPNIKFWGKVQDIAGFLSACDVIVIPSRWEPWGNVCAEAKAAGKPVIVSDIDGLTEQARGCGLLVPVEDVAQLASAIDRMATLPPEVLTAWGAAGRETVRDAWHIYLNSWEALLWDVVNS